MGAFYMAYQRRTLRRDISDTQIEKIISTYPRKHFNYIEPSSVQATPYLLGTTSSQMHQFFHQLFDSDTVNVKHIMVFTGASQVSVKIMFDDENFGTPEKCQLEYFAARLRCLHFNGINEFGVVYLDEMACNITQDDSSQWYAALQQMKKGEELPSIVSFQLYAVHTKQEINLNALYAWLNMPLPEVAVQLQKLSYAQSAMPQGRPRTVLVAADYDDYPPSEPVCAYMHPLREVSIKWFVLRNLSTVSFRRNIYCDVDSSPNVIVPNPIAPLIIWNVVGCKPHAENCVSLKLLLGVKITRGRRDDLTQIKAFLIAKGLSDVVDSEGEIVLERGAEKYDVVLKFTQFTQHAQQNGIKVYVVSVPLINTRIKKDYNLLNLFKLAKYSDGTVTAAADPATTAAMRSEITLTKENECVYCFDAIKTIAIEPCGHTTCCQDCFLLVQQNIRPGTNEKCPVCTHKVSRYVHKDRFSGLKLFE